MKLPLRGSKNFGNDITKVVLNNGIYEIAAKEIYNETFNNIDGEDAPNGEELQGEPDVADAPAPEVSIPVPGVQVSPQLADSRNLHREDPSIENPTENAMANPSRFA